MSNMVRTSKYKWYNFLPKFLWEEFNPASKVANVYFLFIAGLQVRALAYGWLAASFWPIRPWAASPGHGTPSRVALICAPLLPASKGTAAMLIGELYVDGGVRKRTEMRGWMPRYRRLPALPSSVYTSDGGAMMVPCGPGCRL